MRGNIIKKRLMSFTFEKIPRISLSCMLVLVQYREYGYGLFIITWMSNIKEVQGKQRLQEVSEFKVQVSSKYVSEFKVRNLI